MMFTMYASPDSGFSSPLSLPSCSAFDPLASPSALPKIRRRLSFESIDTPATKDAATQTEPELTEEEIEQSRRVGRKLRAFCDEFDFEYFQPHRIEAVPAPSSYSPSSSPSSFSYSSLVVDFILLCAWTPSFF